MRLSQTIRLTLQKFFSGKEDAIQTIEEIDEKVSKSDRLPKESSKPIENWRWKLVKQYRKDKNLVREGEEQ